MHEIQNPNIQHKHLELHLRIGSAYGRNLYYPNCPDSERFAKLIGCKTFTEDKILQIRKLGFNILYKVDLP